MLVQEEEEERPGSWGARALKYYEICKGKGLPALYDFDQLDVSKRPEFPILSICFPKRLPTKTRGIDYSASYLLCDPSIQHNITLNVFRAKLTDFPNIDPSGWPIFC